MASVMYNKAEITRRDGTKLILHAVHVPDPEIWDLNRDGVLEDYYVIEDGAEPALIRVSSRSPFMLEPINSSSLHGGAYRQRAKGYLQSENSELLG